MTSTNEPLNESRSQGKSAQQRFDESKPTPGKTVTVKAFKNLSGQYVFNWYDAQNVLTKHVYLEPSQVYLLLELCSEYFTGNDSTFQGIEWLC